MFVGKDNNFRSFIKGPSFIICLHSSLRVKSNKREVEGEKSAAALREKKSKKTFPRARERFPSKLP